MSVVVAVDDREPATLVETVRTHADVAAIEVQRLDVGDVVIGDVGVERKTLADYTSTLLARSGPDLYDQIRRLDEAYAHSYLLLEAELPPDGMAGVPAVTIRGSAASITARLDTPVIPCSDQARLVDMAVRLGRKHVEDPSTPALPAGAVTALDAPTAKRMYGCIDGVGPETAERLYEVYPAVADLVTATREELMAIDGIGPTRAETIHGAVRGPE